MFSGLFAFIGRLLLASFFIVSGLQRLAELNGSDRYFAEVGMPANLMFPVALFEVIGGAVIALGIFTRLTSLVFAIFCLIAAAIVQAEAVEAMRISDSLKYVAIAGGFFCLFAYEGKSWSLDSYRARRRAEAVRVPASHPGVGVG